MLWSKAGASLRPASMDGVLDADVLAEAFVPMEIVDMVETAEEMDALEPLRWGASVGLLGGKAGEGWVECLRGGRAGGGGFFSPVRVIVGGGRTRFWFSALGSLPMALLM